MKAELEKAAHGVCEHFFRIEDILVWISSTNVAILDFCGGFDLFRVH